MPITLTASDPTPDLRPLQIWLDEVRYPRNRLNCRGAGVTVRVLDGGLRSRHEGLLNPRIFFRPSQLGTPPHDLHGTSVMGFLAGTGPIQGMCPDAVIQARLWYTLQGEFRDAAATMTRGDVLLIERDLSTGHYNGVPVEYSPDLQPGIIECVNRGIIPIIPVGNSNTNLDTLAQIPYSGAIWVGSAHVWTDGQGQPTADTSYGSRVDVCAPGWKGITCGPSDYIDGPDPLRHYGWFGGTSMASAIVAGACACINSARIEAGQDTLDAPRMRNLLVRTGHTVAYPRCPIGRLIDVTRALQESIPDPDFDMDGKVGWSDFFEFAECWRTQDMRGDFDGDGQVTWRDFNVLRRRFGEDAKNI